MGAAAYIGRVGSLAVVLGVGTAMGLSRFLCKESVSSSVVGG